MIEKNEKKESKSKKDPKVDDLEKEKTPAKRQRKSRALEDDDGMDSNECGRGSKRTAVGKAKAKSKSKATPKSAASPKSAAERR